MIMAVCSAEAAQHRTISINCVSAHSLAAIALDKVHCKIWTGNSQDAMYSCIVLVCKCLGVEYIKLCGESLDTKEFHKELLQSGWTPCASQLAKCCCCHCSQGGR